MTDTYRIVGAPGCGKTQALRDTVALWMDRDGYQPEDFVLTSYTRSAAAVLRGRVAVPDEQVATLHALAYRALGRPPLAEVGDLAKQWDALQVNRASWQIAGNPVSTEDDGLAMPDGEAGEQLRLYSLARMRMLPAHHPYFEMTRAFAGEWEAFKRETNSVDFVDMLDLALVEAPLLTQPVLIVDEAQDLVPLQWALVKHWGSVAERFVVAGDPAQVLYRFAGASPDGMLTPLEGERLWSLPRSYRLPAAVQRHAERYLAGHSGPMSVGREYAPRQSEGAVRGLAATWRRPEDVVEEAARIVDAAPPYTPGEISPVMIVATCAYMLQPTVAALREAGLPFENRYRRANGSWNPLASAQRRAEGGGDGPRSTALMIAAFVDGAPAQEWVELLRTDTFLMRAGKKMIADGTEDVAGMLKPQHRAAFEARDTQWLASRMLAQYRAPADYVIRLIQRRGTAALRQPPRIQVGTVHSVKGGEAGHVIIYPDISMAGAEEQAASIDGADAAIRLGYVALTRASEEVVLCDAADPRRMLW